MTDDFSNVPAVGFGAREKLYSFLSERPAGARAEELLGILFRGAGSDADLGHKLIEQLIGADPHFSFEQASGLWSLRENGSLRVPLEDARFVVVDLETTGARVGPGAIIEIGAYRMHGGRIVESFDTLVRPYRPVSSFVTRLTTITNEMVREAPPIDDIMPRFRDFLGDAVLVAHNAQFDFSHLDFEFRRLFGIGLTNPVLCTLRMSRRMLPSLRRRRLDYLAEHFGLSTAGRHRGLGDARMAAEILAIFLDMARQMGISRLDLLLDMQGRSPAGVRIERHVAPESIAALPEKPGVYIMRNQRGEILYAGKARRLKSRVASYFNAGMGIKAKTAELVSHVYQIDIEVTRSSLEAAIEEARIIRELKPPYNRMLKSAPATNFIKIDLMDPFPRLVVTPKFSRRDGVMCLGPFAGRQNLERGVRALSKMLGLRTCAGKLKTDENFSPCIYGQIGRCAMPCNGSIGEDEYGARMRNALEFIRGRSGRLAGEMAQARDDAARSMRFEAANRYRRDLEAIVTLAARATRLSQVVTENNLVIITGEAGDRAAYVILGGRIALSIKLDADGACDVIPRFIAENYDRYRALPVRREELESMTIVARWLRERGSDEGRIIYLSGAYLPPGALR
ncbi:MAG: exonuclease domain-containing protein [Candidatus Binataceae bacterium]